MPHFAHFPRPGEPDPYTINKKKCLYGTRLLHIQYHPSLLLRTRYVPAVTAGVKFLLSRKHFSLA